MNFASLIFRVTVIISIQVLSPEECQHRMHAGKLLYWCQTGHFYLVSSSKGFDFSPAPNQNATSRNCTLEGTVTPITGIDWFWHWSVLPGQGPGNSRRHYDWAARIPHHCQSTGLQTIGSHQPRDWMAKTHKLKELSGLFWFAHFYH